MLKPKRILLVYYLGDGAESARITVQQHLNAFQYCRIKHQITYLNTFDLVPNYAQIDKPSEVPPGLAEKMFDVIVFHYTFLAFRTIGHYFSRWKQQFEWLNTYRALRIAMPQDEGNFAGLLDDWLYELNVQIIFSVHYTSDGPLYPIMRHYANIYPCLPGYIDENDANGLQKRLRPLKERPYDIVYRARKLPWCYGTAGRMKSLVADVVKPIAVEKQLCVDISTRYEDTLFGDKWWDFISSGRATIGSPGGYSVIDWRGEIKAKVQVLLNRYPGIRFEKLSDLMPEGWDDHHLLTITPRHFEAVITKTCQILVENSYKGILIPNRHYLPIKKDFSNVNEVVKQLRDVRFLQEIADVTYSEIFLKGKYSYRHFAYQIEEAIKNFYKNNQFFIPGVGVIEMTQAKDLSEFDRALNLQQRQFIAQRSANDMQQALMEQKYLDLIQELSSLKIQMQSNYSQLYAYLQEWQNAIQIKIDQIYDQCNEQVIKQNRFQNRLIILFFALSILISAAMIFFK